MFVMGRAATGRAIALPAVVFVIAAGLAGWTQRGALLDWARERPYRAAIPAAQPVRPRAVSPRPAAPMTTRAVAPLPLSLRAPAELGWEDVNLTVPFQPQAPHANWGQPYQDACEEATIIMIERALRGGRTLTADEMDREILRLVEFSKSRYGFFLDQNSAETARLAEDFYPSLSATVRYDVTEADIRSALAQGRPVLVLVNGRIIGNPFYTRPGPLKHALVIKGVVANKFITNDPGTKRGADLVYPIETILNAMGDYDGGTPGTGKRAMVLLSRK